MTERRKTEVAGSPRRHRYRVPPRDKLSAAAVLVLLGTGVVATGADLLDGTASAATLMAAGHTVPRLPGPPSMTAPAVAGAVESVNTTTASFAVLTLTGTTETVDVTSSTSYTEPGVKSASLTTLKKGDHVMVQGSTSSGTVTATAVFIGYGPGQGFAGSGGPGAGGPAPGGPGGGGPGTE